MLERTEPDDEVAWLYELVRADVIARVPDTLFEILSQDNAVLRGGRQRGVSAAYLTPGEEVAGADLSHRTTLLSTCWISASTAANSASIAASGRGGTYL